METENKGTLETVAVALLSDGVALSFTHALSARLSSQLDATATATATGILDLAPFTQQQQQGQPTARSSQHSSFAGPSRLSWPACKTTLPTGRPNSPAVAVLQATVPGNRTS